MTRRCMFFLLALGICGMTAARAEEWVSGDGRFTLKKMNETDDFALVEVSSGKPVMGTEELVHSADGSIATVWAKDSQQVAVNFRAGGKYDATQVYAWKGGQFGPMADVVDLLATRIEAERKTEMKRMKLPATTSLRSIYETYRALRWADAQTLEVYVRSEKEYVRNRQTEDTDSVVVAVVYTVRFDKKGAAKVVDRRKPTEREKEG